MARATAKSGSSRIVKRAIKVNGSTSPVDSVAGRDTRSAQLQLFDSVFSGPQDKVRSGQHPFTNSFVIYDQAPKYVTRDDSSRRVLEDADGSRYLKVVKRYFTLGGEKYLIEIHPARFVDEDGVEEEIHPGKREELVEKAIRRIAIQGRRTRERIVRHRKDAAERRTVGVLFTLHEVRQELARHGFHYSAQQIRQAIQVCGRTTIVITPPRRGAPQIEGKMFEFVAFGAEAAPDGEGQEGDRKVWVSFNSMVAEDIENYRYRQMNHDSHMSLRTAPARWLHERLCHSWTWAELGRSFDILASTIINDSGLVSYSNSRDAFRRVEFCIAELIDHGIVNNVELEEYRGERNKLIDILFKLYPTPEFVREMKAANWRDNELESKLAEIQADEPDEDPGPPVHAKRAGKALPQY